MTPLARRASAELLGTAMLVTAVVGSGIAAERLAPGEPGLQLLVNALATAAALVAILLAVGPVSGGHLNPVISLTWRGPGGLGMRETGVYVGAQLTGGAIGVAVTSFANPAVTLARTLTDTFSGIAPGSAPAFLAAQLVGALLALAAVRVLFPPVPAAVDDAVVPG